MGKLDNEVAIVTGGASGLGAGIVKKFIAEGAKVVILDFNLKPLEGKTQPDSVKVVQGDVSDPESWKKTLQTAIDAFGKLTIICNNAGICTNAEPMHEMPLSTLDKLLNVNLKAIFVSAHVIFPYFIQNNIKGVMVNTISTSATRPRPGLAFYGASKSGAEGATKCLAIEYAKYGIRVCGVSPSIANTQMAFNLTNGGNSEEATKALGATLPLGVIGEPEDIANMTAQLACSESRVVTGIIVPVDSGRCI